MPAHKPADHDGEKPPKTTRKQPKARKPLPAKRPRIGEEDPEPEVSRRRPPRAGVDDVLTAEVRRQMVMRKGWTRSEAARQVGWNVHSAARLLSSKGPSQAWTAGEMVDMARGLGCSVSSLIRGAGIDPEEDSLIDRIYSDGELSADTKQSLVRQIRLERMARSVTEDGLS